MYFSLSYLILTLDEKAVMTDFFYNLISIVYRSASNDSVKGNFYIIFL